MDVNTLREMLTAENFLIVGILIAISSFVVLVLGYIVTNSKWINLGEIGNIFIGGGIIIFMVGIGIFLIGIALDDSEEDYYI